MGTQRRRVVVIFALGAVCLVAVASVAGGPAVRVVRHRVEPSWLPVSTPEEQGMDSERLGNAVVYLTGHRLDYRPHQVIVARHGQRVLDVALYPFTQGLRHDIASVGKMVTGTLIGIAIDRGFIASVDEPVLSFFPDREIANRDARKEAMTIAHLLAQRSGIYHGTDGGHAEEDFLMEASPDWVQFVLDRPMAEAPGGTWYYSNANLHLAAGVLTAATGMSPLAFARRYLFDPLWISDVRWESDPQGVNLGYGGQEIRPIDLAKIAQLYLDDGRCGSRQVLSRAWVSRSTSPSPGPPPAGWPPEYSVGFHWVLADDYREAGGSGGQVALFFPDEDLLVVVVAGGGTPYAGCSDPVALAAPLVSRYILPAVVSSSALPANPTGVARLASLVEAATVSYEGPPQPVPPLPAMASLINGKRFDLEPNPLEIESFTLTFVEPNEATLNIVGGENVTFRIGLDDVHRMSQGESGLPVAAKGWWDGDSEFVVMLDEFALYTYLRVSLEFSGSQVTVTLEDLACPGGPQLVIEGTSAAD
jgi:CubicO group peptidase (beta-lactamase class C family)